jgi:nitrite reductase/ring-hydroxylating ferredoxin subunit
MTETKTGTRRSAGIDYINLLDLDSHPVRDILRAESPMEPGPTRVPVERYFERSFHDLEVEKIWKKVWQMACHEDDIPDVGDYYIYDIAHLSFLIVRTTPDEIVAFPNACLHRGRQLKDKPGRGAHVIRCAFHGWAWNLDGSLREVPCEWDFPEVSAEDYSLPPVKLGRWQGFVFINPNPDAESLEDHIGTLADHFTLLPYERRYKEAHVAKILRCNWKVAANSKYDVFGNFSRAISPNMTPSPHLVGGPGDALDGAMLYTRLKHPMSGLVYERIAEDVVEVTDAKGQASRFAQDGSWISGPMTQADPHMCNWIGGRQLPGAEGVRAPTLTGDGARAMAASGVREHLRGTLGDEVDQFSDAELLDSIYLTLFPNFHPWGSFNRIVYRFRPNGDNPEECIHECMYFSPVPTGQPRPPAAPIHWLGPDDDWVDAPELGMLSKVFNQDVLNLPFVQRGLKNLPTKEVVFGNYGETKLRHFHELLNQWLAR